LLLSLIVLRLAYWQIIQGSRLRTEARSQYSERAVSENRRGEIISADNAALVINEPIYNIGVYLPGFSGSPSELPTRVSEVLDYEILDPLVATDPARSPLAMLQLKE